MTGPSGSRVVNHLGAGSSTARGSHRDVSGGTAMIDTSLLEATAERQLAAVTELAARWHRSDDPSPVAAGMRIGWAQSIALITGIPYADVARQLRAGDL